MIKRLLHTLATRKAFDRACANDSVGLQKLLDSGVSAAATRCYDKTDIQQSLLLCAVESKSYECATTLLDAGANPNTVNEVHSSPFRRALGAMERTITGQFMEFRPDLPYETHPALELVAKMFVLGGDRHYLPAGLAEVTILDFSGPSRASQQFEAVIDAWLETQGSRLNARLMSQGFDRDTKPASGSGSPIPRM